MIKDILGKEIKKQDLQKPENKEAGNTNLAPGPSSQRKAKARNTVSPQPRLITYEKFARFLYATCLYDISYNLEVTMSIGEIRGANEISRALLSAKVTSKKTLRVVRQIHAIYFQTSHTLTIL